MIKKIILFFLPFSVSLACSTVPKDRIMTIEEAGEIIANNEFLKSIGLAESEEALYGDSDESRGSHGLNINELSSIELSHEYAATDFGGVFAEGRHINDFKGDTLVVGGGKAPGEYGNNRGITVLRCAKGRIAYFEGFWKTLRNAKINRNSGGRISDKLRAIAIKKYAEELARVNEEVNEYNSQKLDTYFTLNIDKLTQPDILASITSEKDMAKIPDRRFSKVIFEHINGFVYVNPSLYPILQRIVKPGGTIEFWGVTTSWRRFMIPFMESLTPWGDQVKSQFYKEIVERRLPVNQYWKIIITT